MPKGYAIFTEQVNDHVAMGEYDQAAMPSVMAAGAIPLSPALPQTYSKVNGTALGR